MGARLATALATAVACAACGAVDDATTIDDRVVTLTGDIAVDGATVSAPRAGNDGIAPGTIVIGDRGDGLLRGVTAVHEDGDRLVLDTVPATLDDAVIDGDVTGTLALSDDGKADTYGLGHIAVDVANRHLLDNQYVSLTLDRATLRATPTIDLDLTMRDRALDHFAAVLHGDLDATIDVEVSAHKGVIHPALPLWTSPPQLFVQWVGWVPVVETVTLSVGLRLDTTATGDASAHLTGTAHVALSGGVTYDAGTGFAPVASFEHAVSGSVTGGAHLDALTLRAYLYTQVDVKFYGLVGPFINAGPYVDSDDRAGMYAEVGGSINAFGVHLPAMPRIVLYDSGK